MKCKKCGKKKLGFWPFNWPVVQNYPYEPPFQNESRWEFAQICNKCLELEAERIHKPKEEVVKKYGYRFEWRRTPDNKLVYRELSL